MDQDFNEIQAKIAKRLIHSDRHRRRKSIAPEIVTCNSSKNHDLSRLRSRNDVLFKDLEKQLTTLKLEQRRRQGEMKRSQNVLTGSYSSLALSHLNRNNGLGGRTPWYEQNKNNQSQTKKMSPSLAKHMSVMQNDVSNCEDDVKKWREKVDRQSLESNTQMISSSRKLDKKETLQIPSLCSIEEETHKRSPLDALEILMKKDSRVSKTNSRQRFRE